MPAISFQEEWLDMLLSGEKQQTTRPQTDRFKVGDVCSIYNQQRRRIIDKPLRKLTKAGIAAMPMDRYPFPQEGMHHAHLLGKARIARVYDMLPVQCTCGEEAWAKKDGFVGADDAFAWFEAKYGEGWVDRWWTVTRWTGWQERYFEPEDSNISSAYMPLQGVETFYGDKWK